MFGALHEDISTLWHCCVSNATMVMQHVTMLHYTYDACLVSLWSRNSRFPRP